MGDHGAKSRKTDGGLEAPSILVLKLPDAVILANLLIMGLLHTLNPSSLCLIQTALPAAPPPVQKNYFHDITPFFNTSCHHDTAVDPHSDDPSDALTLLLQLGASPSPRGSSSHPSKSPTT